ncbi:photosystem II protein PsbQ [Stanieria cyanosphaera PCC 7437]|uniref:Photosystem II protein PsbQ n=1 Tax=Stanieria cyanosphaera (strain ATCC 29371 / PCC 7437) TaxID=111780 RepID=K9XZA3_STAC7|nr:photosystem II protein PsbQ [Stanieria cyanosphaera]AFZ36992.1 photosystem II protein PsbQ [Stanieria cyanosphaera PCC 7437]
MRIFRSILPLILVLVTTFLVSCGSPTVSAPPTYTPAKLQQIKTYRIPVDVAQQRMAELGQYIQAKDWVDTESFIHGPLGLIRRDMTYLANSLLPEDKEKATELAKEVFDGLEELDAAAKEKSYTSAIQKYGQVVRNLNSYLELLPKSEAS